MNFSKRNALALLLFAVLLFAMAIHRQQLKKPHTKHKDKILVAMSPDFPPFGFYKDGKIVGLEIDILNDIQKRTGLNFRIMPMEFSGIMASMESGKIKMTISAMSPTPERKKILNFSPSYYESSMVAVFNANQSLKNLHEICGKSIGVQAGTTMENYLKKHFLKCRFNLQSVSNNSMLIEMLKMSLLDAVIMENEQAKIFTNKNSNLGSMKIASSQNASYAIAFSKNFEYESTVSRAVEEMKNSGHLEQLQKKWSNLEQNSDLKPALIWIAKGAYVTIKYALVSFFIAFFLANILALLRVSSILPLKIMASLYTSIIRGTPLLLQLSLVYFALPSLLNCTISIFAAGVITFSANSAAYISEIIRGGLESIEKGQFEAAESLNLSKYQTYKDIILPQVFRNISPSLINEIISLTKETCIISFLGEIDIIKRANIVTAEHYTYFIPLCVAGLVYYVISLSLEVVSSYVSKKFVIK